MKAQVEEISIRIGRLLALFFGPAGTLQCIFRTFFMIQFSGGAGDGISGGGTGADGGISKFGGGGCDTGQTLLEVETGRELGISRGGRLQQGQHHLQFSVQVHFEREKRGERSTNRSAPPSKHEMNHLLIDSTVSSFDDIDSVG